MFPGSRLVITIRHELYGPVLAMMALWVAAALIALLFAHASELWFVALGSVALLSGALLWIARPRRGELVRLVLDVEHRTIYWAHRGTEPEELAFAALRALVVEAFLRGRVLTLHAVEESGRWVSLGQGPAKQLAPFAREVARRVGVPIWWRQPDDATLPELTDLVVLSEDEKRIG
jgi:hypothetical protein